MLECPLCGGDQNLKNGGVTCAVDGPANLDSSWRHIDRNGALGFWVDEALGRSHQAESAELQDLRLQVEPAVD